MPRHRLTAVPAKVTTQAFGGTVSGGVMIWSFPKVPAAWIESELTLVMNDGRHVLPSSSSALVATPRADQPGYAEDSRSEGGSAGSANRPLHSRFQCQASWIRLCVSLLINRLLQHMKVPHIVTR